jgi:hypothetical protein
MGSLRALRIRALHSPTACTALSPSGRPTGAADGKPPIGSLRVLRVLRPAARAAHFAARANAIATCRWSREAASARAASRSASPPAQCQRRIDDGPPGGFQCDGLLMGSLRALRIRALHSPPARTALSPSGRPTGAGDGRPPMGSLRVFRVLRAAVRDGRPPMGSLRVLRVLRHRRGRPQTSHRVVARFARFAPPTRATANPP